VNFGFLLKIKGLRLFLEKKANDISKFPSFLEER